jgi:hypothetical protein
MMKPEEIKAEVTKLLRIMDASDDMPRALGLIVKTAFMKGEAAGYERACKEIGNG